MSLRNWLLLSWLAWIVLWIAWGFTAKATKRRQPLAVEWPRRIFIIWGFWMLFTPSMRIGPLASFVLPESLTTNLVAIFLTVTGFGLTIWARVHLGGNWSSSVTVKYNHELIQTGPYRIVRHPIYSGATIAALGLAVVNRDVCSLVAIVVMLVGWRLKAASEEQFMIEEFGDVYLKYMRNVKALIPFIW
jgi:protein-S-isoprenylcysteine O-methyltransferase Ste14